MIQEMLIVIGFIALFWTVIHTIFLSQNVKSFSSTLLIFFLHYASFYAFLHFFPAFVLDDFIAWMYALFVFLMHSLMYSISSDLNRNASYIGWFFLFAMLNFSMVMLWNILFL